MKAMRGWMKKHEESHPFFPTDSGIHMASKALGTIL